ncbi:MAG: aldo/keto reductase [bacterium]|nr:aldo/keto reductase [bacterium]
MESIKLNNGNSIPIVGLGVFQTRDGEETVNAVKWALEAGYRHIDTASYYHNEESVGIAIKESGIPREDIFVTTKVWNNAVRENRVQGALERSLARLDMDYVDLFLIHWPVDGFEAAWKTMESLYEQGMIKAIGLSNFHKHHVERIDAIANVAPAADQIESNPYFSNQELIDYLQGRGIAVEAWSPLGGTGGNIMEDALLQSLAEKYGKSPAQIIIRWNMQRGVIVLPKSTHQERIIQNFAVEDFELDEDDVAAISALDCGWRTGPDPDNFNF